MEESKVKDPLFGPIRRQSHPKFAAIQDLDQPRSESLIRIDVGASTEAFAPCFFAHQTNRITYSCFHTNQALFRSLR